jgi:hypothetical protein
MRVPDATMTRIGRGMELGQRGEREAARVVFAKIWSDIGCDDGDPLHRCAVAHAMADVQDDVREELIWDLVSRSGPRCGQRSANRHPPTGCRRPSAGPTRGPPKEAQTAAGRSLARSGQRDPGGLTGRGDRATDRAA